MDSPDFCHDTRSPFCPGPGCSYKIYGCTQIESMTQMHFNSRLAYIYILFICCTTKNVKLCIRRDLIGKVENDGIGEVSSKDCGHPTDLPRVRLRNVPVQGLHYWYDGMMYPFWNCGTTEHNAEGTTLGSVSTRVRWRMNTLAQS